MGFYHFSTHSSCLDKKDEINTKGVSNDDFFHWFSGFTDAEGNFLITLDREYIKFRFKINLHIDDVKVLYLIKSKLNIGRVYEENAKNRCSFIVEKYSDIKNVICPLFKSYPLHTSKKLDFVNFYEAVHIKDKKNLSNAHMQRITFIKNSMNTKRDVFTYNT